MRSDILIILSASVEWARARESSANYAAGARREDRLVGNLFDRLLDLPATHRYNAALDGTALQKSSHRSVSPTLGQAGHSVTMTRGSLKPLPPFRAHHRAYPGASSQQAGRPHFQDEARSVVRALDAQAPALEADKAQAKVEVPGFEVKLNASMEGPPSVEVQPVSPSLEHQVTLSKVDFEIGQAELNNEVKRRRKRDVIYAAWRRVVSWLRKDTTQAAKEIVDEECKIDEPEVCADESRVKAIKEQLRGLMSSTIRSFVGVSSRKQELEALEIARRTGEQMEMGWQKRGNGSSLARSREVWLFLARAGVKVLQAKRTKGTLAEVSAAKTSAAEFIRDSLFVLGPTFVKLGQVLSARTDILDTEYIEVLRDLQDNVPGFGGDKAVSIVEENFGRKIGEIYDSFEKEPIAAASLGQVHRAVYKGQPIAVKVQRAGLRSLFDTDLKNLGVLAKLLDKLDPKVGGADRSYYDIFEESAKLLYEEIDYTIEGKNAERFSQSFADIGVDYIRVPKIYWEVTNSQVLTMEFIDSIKLTEIKKIEEAGLDKAAIASQIADSFLAQILKTAFFHCDPHPGNLQCDRQGKLVYFDCGMMNELKPNLAQGFKDACLAIFGGGPYISDIELDRAGKDLANALERAGVLQKGADRLSVEKVTRYWVRSFKGLQLGKSVSSIRKTIGADLRSLTQEQVWRFPSTFTFIFRAYASIDGTAKALSPDTWDIAKSAQPFIMRLSQEDAASSGANQLASRLATATGLNPTDIDVAISQPKKVQYLEQTVRAMEQGDLKIRVRSLENEIALQRLAIGQAVTNKLIVATLFLNLAVAGVTPIPTAVYYAGAVLAGAQAGWGFINAKRFDRQARRYEADKEFNSGDGDGEVIDTER